MASIQKRGDNSFLLVVELGYNAVGKRIKRTKTIKVTDEKLLRTKKKLKDYLDKQLYKFQLEIEAGEYISPEKRKFNDFINDWYHKFAKSNYELRTLQNYEEKIDNYILPHFGSKRLEQIKPIHVINLLMKYRNQMPVLVVRL